jgi:UDP-2,4-diacetamido-2,4,6-trideoxy-beta-L-altropyranose hydrolase
MRCLSFAEKLRWAGWRCAFLANPEARDVVPALRHDSIDLIDGLEGETYDLAVIDHYGLEADYERSIGDAGARVVVFDDLADRAHHCSILVDPTPVPREQNYRARTGNTARLLLGPAYAMIADAWLSRRPAALARLASATKVERVFVSMGGTDPTNATGRVLNALTRAKLDVHIDAVLGAQSPYRDDVLRLQNERLAIHVAHPDNAALAAKADLAIGAAGTSSFERAVLGLPSIMIPLSENQRDLAATFAEAQAAEVLQHQVLDTPPALVEHFLDLALDTEKRRRMSQRAAALTDGRGRLRLLAAIAGECQSRSAEVVTLRLAESEDENWLLELQRQKATRQFARNPAVPSASEHAMWFAEVLEDPARFLTIIIADGTPCGMLRLDRLAGPKPVFEISVAVDVRWRRTGVGRAALLLARQLAPGADLIATVKPENAPSLALFAAAGYSPEGGDVYRCRAA